MWSLSNSSAKLLVFNIFLAGRWCGIRNRPGLMEPVKTVKCCRISYSFRLAFSSSFGEPLYWALLDVSLLKGRKGSWQDGYVSLSAIHKDISKTISWCEVFRIALSEPLSSKCSCDIRSRPGLVWPASRSMLLQNARNANNSRDNCTFSHRRHVGDKYLPRTFRQHP